MSAAASEQTPLLQGSGVEPVLPGSAGPSPLASARSACPEPTLGRKVDNDAVPPCSARSSCCEPFTSIDQKRWKRLLEYVTQFQDHEHERVCSYETNKLGTWMTFFYTAGTVWRTKQIWEVASHLLILSMCVALITFFVTVTPESLDASMFGLIANFLKVFVAFLLGYYITSSMARWMDTIEGFLVLFNAARNLMMQLHALGVSGHWIQQISRYGILSAKFLSNELKNPTEDGEDDDDEDEESGKNKTLAESRNDTVDRFLGEELLKADEAEVLRKVSDHATLMWVWVALILGRMAQEGEIPPMASPTYGRLMDLTQDGQEGIRQVYVSMMVQMPFVYVHMLAMLVHSNNIFCAISFGCTLGQSVATILARFNIRIYENPVHKGGGPPPPVDGSVQGDIQLILMSLVTSLFAPLLYQAALQIGLVLAQPFNTEVGSIPTNRLIETLKRDLKHAQIMADEPPGFDKPYFKQPKQG